MSTNYWDILTECAEIAKERWEQYWTPDHNFKSICDISKEIFNRDVLPSEMCEHMIATKLGRCKQSYKEDTWMDLVNYIAMMIYFRRNWK